MGLRGPKPRPDNAWNTVEALVASEGECTLTRLRRLTAGRYRWLTVQSAVRDLLEEGHIERVEIGVYRSRYR